MTLLSAVLCWAWGGLLPPGFSLTVSLPSSSEEHSVLPCAQALLSPVVTARRPEGASSVGGHSGKPWEFLQTDALILKAAFWHLFILFVPKYDFHVDALL